MNEILDSLLKRKSVRVFTEKEISPEDREMILRCAAAAPTAGNQQLYTILDITDPALKKALSESCDHQPFIAEAKMVLIFLADCKKWYDAYLEAGCMPRAPGKGDLMLAVTDAAIAAQNAVCAAESLGIGSCYIGDIMENREEHRRLLKLPDWVFPAAMLVLGYPTQQQKQRKKPERVDMKYIVRQNRYDPLSGEELRGMLAPRAGEAGFDKWVQAFHARKYDSGFAREMSRSVEEYLREYDCCEKK